MKEHILSGRYKIIETIGHGGMSTVYKAEDLALKRWVAVKVMHTSLNQNDEFIQRFNWEARVTSSLSHRNIVRLYDAGYDDQSHFLVMEYVKGTMLKELIQQKGQISVKESIFIMLQLCDALAHAHQNGIIHRDIKPQNIMSSGNNHYKIMDFGISRVGDVNLTKTGSVMGSVHYFSPEQAQGKHVDLTSDLYSLGVVLYEMLTGHPPYDAPEEVAVALKHIQAEIPNPQEYNPAIPDVLAQIVTKAMSKNPADRFQSADEMKEALQQVQLMPIDDEMPTATKPITQPSGRLKTSIPNKKTRTKLFKTSAKKKWIWGVASVLSLFLVLIIGFQWANATFLEKQSQAQKVETNTAPVNNVQMEQEEKHSTVQPTPIEKSETEEPKQIKPKQDKLTPEPPTKEYIVVVGSFEERENAIRLKELLTQQSIDTDLIESTVFGKTMFRVHTGKHESKSKAEEQLLLIHKSGIKGAENAFVLKLDQMKK